MIDIQHKTQGTKRWVVYARCNNLATKTPVIIIMCHALGSREINDEHLGFKFNHCASQFLLLLFRAFKGYIFKCVLLCLISQLDKLIVLRC
ncbi:hypothetical protein AHF37_10120 [Paragonimus kellicotti]|nr:hypothetical protein AHF37_10120 [Paragonimus kellicotti]